ncbi:MAG: hypothetical protein GXP32_03875 [Kiritimatiellaeota bacterium]|nr:hypothetical protein [Kiritimatiellota bacterium]
MTSPLDDLRNTTKSIQQKQEKNLKQTQRQRLEQQELLAKSSDERQQQIRADAKALANKSKKMKIIVMSIVVALLCALFAFFVRVFVSGNRVSSRKTDLASSGEFDLDANDNEYVPLKKFITKTIADFKKNKDAASIRWYSTLPAGRRERYAKTMRDLELDDSWSVYEIRKDPKRERFSIHCRKDKKRSIFFEVVYNDDMEFEIVKVY